MMTTLYLLAWAYADKPTDIRIHTAVAYTDRDAANKHADKLSAQNPDLNWAVVPVKVVQA